MSSSYTSTNTSTFTITHAKYLASKVAADLKRIQRFYGHPTDKSIEDYDNELIEYLKNGYLLEVTYGFKRNGSWIEPTLKYKAQDLLNANVGDDDPGLVKPNADISGASFYSYLISNDKYAQLSEIERENFKKNLPFRRGEASEPGLSGYLSSDKTYSSGGHSLNRSSVKSL